jgi:hypothetical protein
MEGLPKDPLCRAETLYDFPGDDQVQIEEGIQILHLRKGEIVHVYEKDASGWWFGELNGNYGVFPGTFMKELPPPTKSVAAAPAKQVNIN